MCQAYGMVGVCPVFISRSKDVDRENFYMSTKLCMGQGNELVLGTSTVGTICDPST